MQPCMGCSCYKLKQPAAVCKHADADYQAFLKQLEEGPELLPSAAIQREQQEKAAASRSPDDVAAASAIKVTPIMEYLRNKYLNNPGLRPGRKGGRHTAKEVEVSTIPDQHYIKPVLDQLAPDKQLTSINASKQHTTGASIGVCSLQME